MSVSILKIYSTYTTYSMAKVKNINIKNRPYYLYDDMVNTKDFDSNLLKMDKKLFKNIEQQTFQKYLLHWIYHKRR